MRPSSWCWPWAPVRAFERCRALEVPFAMCLRTEKVFWQEVVGSTGGTYMLYFGAGPS